MEQRHQEDRALDLLVELVGRKDVWQQARPLAIWSISRGFQDPEGKKIGKDETRRPDQALQHIAAAKDPGLFVLKDFHPYLKEGSQGSSFACCAIWRLS